MAGNDLTAAIPWIVFAVVLAVVCVRLWCSGRQHDRESRQPSEDGSDSSANPASVGAPIRAHTRSPQPADPDQAGRGPLPTPDRLTALAGEDYLRLARPRIAHIIGT